MNKNEKIATGATIGGIIALLAYLAMTKQTPTVKTPVKTVRTPHTVHTVHTVKKTSNVLAPKTRTVTVHTPHTPPHTVHTTIHTPHTTVTSLPPSTPEPAPNTVSYLNGVLQLSVNYQFPTYIGYRTTLSNGNQLLLLPLPPNYFTSSNEFPTGGSGCATILTPSLSVYTIAEEMGPNGGPFCQPFGNAFGIYKNFIVFNLPPVGSLVMNSPNARIPMPYVYAISVTTNNGTYAWVLRHVSLSQGALSKILSVHGYWSTDPSPLVIGYGGQQFVTLNSVVSNGQPSAYEYWTKLAKCNFFALLGELCNPVAQVTPITGVQAYGVRRRVIGGAILGVAYSPKAVTTSSSFSSIGNTGYYFKYYTLDQLIAIWEKNIRNGNSGLPCFLNALGILNVVNVNRVIVSPRGTLSKLLQWALENNQIGGYKALLPGPLSNLTNYLSSTAQTG